MLRSLLGWLLISTLLSCDAESKREEQATVRVAVAANFVATATRLATVFTRATGHEAVVSHASSGQLFAQIQAEAPFDVFLSADRARPEALEQAGQVVLGTRFTYARGQVSLWSPVPGVVDANLGVLRDREAGAIALADPRTAPYGAHAKRFLQAQGLWDPLQADGRLAVAASVTQAHQFVASGAARAGFVAHCQVLASKRRGSHWPVPSEKDALDQQAVLLRRGADNPAARAWLEFLRTPAARALIEADGYGVP